MPEERVPLKTQVGQKKERLRITLIELRYIVGSGSNDEDRAAQNLATLVSTIGTTKSVSEEIFWSTVSSALRAGETYLKRG